MIKNISDLPQNAIDLVRTYLLDLQNQLCQQFEVLDTQAHFQEDIWQRQEGGGGITRILANGLVFEKAGVNFSHVFGQNLPQSASASRPELTGYGFQALGVSVVLHPNNPFVPTTHANVRFFVATKQNAPSFWWFGGGFDLTPYYGFDEDCIHWHQTAHDACLPFGREVYSRFKAWCDRYFYIQHRQEPRGIGGLFFDDYHEQGFAHSFGLMQSIGNHFIKAYAPIVLRRKDLAYTPEQKAFQRYRRGRYVEFNLVYDRGTLFGLQSGGRTESILMSLPPEVSWEYDAKPTPGSLEAKLYEDYLVPRDWIGEENNNNTSPITKNIMIDDIPAR